MSKFFQEARGEQNLNSTLPAEQNTPAATPKEPSSFNEILRFSIIAILIVVPIRLFIAQPFIVSGASMEDTFHNREYLIVDQLTYHLEAPKRGEVIIFNYPLDQSKFFIKRVVGVPGDTIDINGNIVTITNEAYPNGIVVDEPYINTMSQNTILTQKLGAKDYFVMGDNRDRSSDSRAWGVLHEDEIVGRAFLRLFPVSRIGVFPGAYDTEAALADEFTNN